MPPPSFLSKTRRMVNAWRLTIDRYRDYYYSPKGKTCEILPAFTITIYNPEKLQPLLLPRNLAASLSRNRTKNKKKKQKGKRKGDRALEQLNAAARAFLEEEYRSEEREGRREYIERGNFSSPPPPPFHRFHLCVRSALLGLRSGLRVVNLSPWDPSHKRGALCPT